VGAATSAATGAGALAGSGLQAPPTKLNTVSPAPTIQYTLVFAFVCIILIPLLRAAYDFLQPSTE
jgi:hypothetical protein